MRIVWHFSARGEAHTYTVAYRFRGLAVAYSDIVDVNLKVWGFELERATPGPERDDDPAEADPHSARATTSGATRRG